jgi:hypothetical protein
MKKNMQALGLGMLFSLVIMLMIFIVKVDKQFKDIKTEFETLEEVEEEKFDYTEYEGVVFTESAEIVASYDYKIPLSMMYQVKISMNNDYNEWDNVTDFDCTMTIFYEDNNGNYEHIYMTFDKIEPCLSAYQELHYAIEQKIE